MFMAALTVEQIIIDYAITHGRTEAFLYNNRLYVTGSGSGNLKVTNPEQYNANWEWIKYHAPVTPIAQ